ncbi:MAG: YicC family protein [Flavobacteriaceae bacterium]|nr:YicC family protein [Flavobacteriaceae bacterium]MDG1962674.1 YicC family protein [Flavobacteriaceae bacterium]
MIYSMTGFGKSVLQLPSQKLTVEIKSLNSKGVDLNTRMPGAYREKELQIRDLVAKSLQRGKIDVSIFIESTGSSSKTGLNNELITSYMEQLKHLAPGEDIDFLKMAIRLPDALKTEHEEPDETLFVQLFETVDQAINELIKYRRDEGLVLENDFKQRIGAIGQLLIHIKALDGQRIPNVRERLTKAMTDLEQNIDKNRFEQELIYYLEKYDITEELVRLDNHLNYFLEALASGDSNGKKLGFITQEIGREINTIGSKSNFAPMQQAVVQMKDELEKIKEQALNVL